MCGIHGFIDESLTQGERDATIRRMGESTVHRGPDYLGYQVVNSFAFAHNRLSIIDLSDQANQPMSKFHYTIVFNGEIYNYKELREDLIQRGHEFLTKSDTEVILVSYKEWGAQCVERFLGMWAFSIYDTQEDTLFCSRDRFGIKPFYYLQDGEKFYFSSEVKSLKESPAFTNMLNENLMKMSVQLGWVSSGSDTMFEKVIQLEPSTNLIYSKGQITTFKYWGVDLPKERISDKEAIHEFKALFYDALKMHIRSDVRVGATLSGGLDSSAIVSAICQEKFLPEVNTFSVYYDGKGEIDERPFVRAVAEKYPEVKAKYLQPSLVDVEEHFNKITYHNDFPLLGSSPISQYFLMKEIKESGIKVILSGQGADDYLGGYMHSYYRFYADAIIGGKLGSLVHELRKQVAYQGLSNKQLMSVLLKSAGSVFFKEKRLLNLECKYSKIFPFLNSDVNMPQIDQRSNRFNDFHQSLLSYSSLPSLLHTEDRNSMAFSIESRVPFLDHRLVELSFALNNSQKIRSGYTKWPLRESMKGVLPEVVKHRKDKIGFVTPGESKWLRKDLNYLLDFDGGLIPGCDKAKLSESVKQFKNGDNTNSKIIWRMANLNYWIKNFA
ncbi:MAG: asparagine synthase (glutamine-hydrolyzing) [Saprospiraceae bacterium]|jgi:asparagine synthase (glutamine-hydrolysing)